MTSCYVSVSEFYGDSEKLQENTIFNIILNTILAITATMGNGMIIIAILRSPNLQTPSYLLITSLAFTDLLVGLVFHPLQAVIYIFFLQNNIHAVCAIITPYKFFFAFLSAMSLLMVTCISIDRYLALTLKHRYTIIVTKKRVLLVTASLWLFALILALLSAMDGFYGKIFIVGCCICSVLMSITSVFYIKSFRALRLYTVQVHAIQPNPLLGNFDVVRYKKTLKTMLVVLGCLLLCYVPAVCTIVVQIVVGVRKESVILFSVSLTFLGLNSSLNPVVYLVRFKDIRNSCRQILRNLIP